MRDYCKNRWVLGVTIVILAVCGGLATYLDNGNWLVLADTALFASPWLVVAIGWDAWQFTRHRHAVQRVTRDDDVDDWPQATSLSEAHYRALLVQAIATDRQLRQQDAEQQQAMHDNFGLWSHQLKTPLAALDLLLQLPEVDVQAARREVKRVERYVQMMLVYLKHQDVNRDLVLVPVALTPLMKSLVRELSDLFIPKNLSVEVADLPTVIGDSQWLRFIFTQVLTNAAKYTEHGGVKITATADGIVIADTGIGIDASDLPRLFEPGYSGYNGRMDQKASGLGLAMSAQIAKQLGMSLSVTSTLGAGTQVTLHIPQTKLTMM